MRKINMIGKKFGRLKVIAENGYRMIKSKRKRLFWECTCSCGQNTIVSGEHLRNGHTKSCGCLQGQKHSMSGTATYNSWTHMINRCNNSNNEFYYCYGGKGITVCEHWLEFRNFFKDMGERPKGFTLDRIDNNKGYYKGNCRWATPLVQTLNRGLNRNNKTGFKGIIWDIKRKKYHVQIMSNYKNYFLGYFEDIDLAIVARKQAELKHWGEIF